LTTKEHLSKHDLEIAAIRTLVHQGMRLLLGVRQAQKRTENNLQRLERNVETLVNTLRRRAMAASRVRSISSEVSYIPRLR
jgi:hypothetical protein